MKSYTSLQGLVSFVVGLLFAIGLALAGMTQPQKVIGFLSINNWDPSLLFVMVGAVGVHMIAYPFVRKRATPLLDTNWHVPTKNDISPKLLIGAVLFGIGWGLGGYCPGPGVASLFSGDLRSLLFVVAMVAGMFLYKKISDT